MDYAFMYIENHPLMLETDYAYHARKSTCKYEASKGVGTVSKFTDVKRDSASGEAGDNLKAALANGPVSVAIEADQYVFQGYTDGVIDHGCGTRLDHGVLAVGYGGDDDLSYIIVKNSWGPSWGDNGYVKIAPNQCGVTLQPSWPTA